VPLLLRLNINAILGFLLVGVVLSPAVLGSLAQQVPALSALVMTNDEGLSALAELGVVFLLFLIGLELSLERLLTMRRLVFGLGGSQVLISTGLIALAATWLGFPAAQAVVFGMALSLSSTAIVIQLFTDAKRLGSQAGRASFAVLLFQDLAVIPILLTVTTLGREANGPVIEGILTALLQAAVAITIIIVCGRFLLQPLLRMAAGSKSTELFMAAVLLSVMGTGAIASYAGLSMALGAFIAGLTLAETAYRRAIESILEPFKGLLLGAFFLLVGLGIDLRALFDHPFEIIALSVALVACKAALIYGLARLHKVNAPAAFESALLLGPGGEFAFVVLGSAATLQIVDHATATTLMLVVSITMAIIPLLSAASRRLMAKRKQMLAATDPKMAEPPDEPHRVIVAGFGRVGHLIGSMLDEHNIKYIAVDADPALASAEHANGFPAYFGDAANPAFLKKCGIGDAIAIAVTMDSPARVDEVVRTARSLNPKVKIVARARDERHAARLYGAGVTEAVPETIESSLQLGEALLVESGIAMGLAIASVHERRDSFRKLLGRPNRKEAVAIERQRLRRARALSKRS
jgi:CPA2 family monovalent cation:H+ antiporter-2